MPRTILFTVLLLAVTLLSGCLVVSGSRKGEQLFTKEQAEKIERGKTTKAEVLQWFGPPVAMARKDKGGQALGGEGDLRPETFFELFTGKHAVGQFHVVYYYRNLRTEEIGAAVLLAASGQVSMKRERLWILINDANGIVEDYVLREDK